MRRPFAGVASSTICPCWVRIFTRFVTFVALALVLALWVLPALITSLTPLTYRQVMQHTRDVLITAFATGSALVVLPLLIERSKELLRQSALSTPESDCSTVFRKI